MLAPWATLVIWSNTTFISNKAVGSVSNVIPVSAGSGYLTTPTITISAPSHPSTDTQAVANVVGEDSTSGGNINTRYISRRVTLEDEFDAGDIKVILNAYKPLGTGIHLYYKEIVLLKNQLLIDVMVSIYIYFCI